MHIDKREIEEANEKLLRIHNQRFSRFCEEVPEVERLVGKLSEFQVAIPSWALGTGGTRFGRFPGSGEPSTIEQKLEDVGLLQALCGSCDAISLHIPWDIPKDPTALRSQAANLGIRFDAVNSNTFQDQPGQPVSYRFGSLQHTDERVRKQAVQHNLEVIRFGKELGSNSITVWLADGSSFPGQLNFREAFLRTLDGLQEIYRHLPASWKMFVEYKAFEPNFYSMTVGDWGQSLLYANKLGSQAFTLVDLGHHLQAANIEQIVALLLMEGKLGGFHFNDSKYGDDDLTVGSINPYQLFLIFNELVEGMDARSMDHATSLGWMIDASHNLKDPLEDLLQSMQAIMVAYAQALLVDQKALSAARSENDVVRAQELLQSAFRTDVRPLLAEVRRRRGNALQPLEAFREKDCRAALVRERGTNSRASGL